MLSEVATRVKQDVRSLVGTIIATMVLYAFGVVDEVVRWIVSRALTEYFETRVRVSALSVWVGVGRIEFEECGVANWSCFSPKKEALEVSNGSVSLDVLGALANRRVVVDKATFGRVRVALCRHPDGSLNFEFFARKKRALYALDSPDDWVEVARPIDERGLGENLDEDDDFGAYEDPGVTTRWTRALLRRAGEAEARLRRQPRRTMFEDAALAAIDAATRAKNSIDESAEQAKQWARDKVRDGLAEGLALAFDKADRAIRDKNTPSKWRLDFARSASVSVDEFSLDLFGADGDALVDEPLVFGPRTLADLDVKTTDADGKPSRVLLKIGFVLAESCVNELVDSRPNDAARLAKAIAKQIARDTTNKTRDIIHRQAQTWLSTDDRDGRLDDGDEEDDVLLGTVDLAN